MLTFYSFNLITAYLFMLACGTSSTALLRHRSIIIQLRLAALYLMHHRLFQQTLIIH